MLPGFRREWIPIIGLALGTAIETARMKGFIALPVTREHEEGRVGSYMWFLAGSAVLLLFFPPHAAAPAILAAAFVDPFIGDARRISAAMAAGGGFILSAALFFLFTEDIALAALAGAVAVAGEWCAVVVQWRRSRYGLLPRGLKVYLHKEPLALMGGTRFTVLDDDLLMMLLPALMVLAAPRMG